MSDLKPTVPDGGESLKIFQLTTDSITDKSSQEYGLAIAKYINSTTSFNTGSYYFTRNARIIKNRNYAGGRIDVQAMFQDRFQFNGKQNYIALNWNALQICNRIVSGLVGRWMERNEKIQVKAIDSLSQTQKDKQYEDLLFVVEQREKLEQLQQESGQQIIPQGDDIPEDKEQLNLWRVELQKLPEEILNEMICNDVLESNGFYDTQKEKGLTDVSVAGLIGTYVWMDNQGVIHVRLIKPENAIYSYSEENDLRDTSWRGEMPSLKISEVRRWWGKEFNPDNPLALSEKDIWEKVIPQCKEWQYQSNILTWSDGFINSFLRPYDEWNVRSLQFELKTVDNESYTVTKTKSNSTYTQKGLPTTQSGKPKDKPSENQNIIGDTNWNIYRGVYLPDCKLLVEWGLKDNMIRPQDPKEIGNAEFSYSYVMPQNYLARNLAIPEKIEAAIDGMILACLKIQQDISLAIPPGWVIDETAWQSVDYGLGEQGNSAVDKAKLYFQTGKVFYRGLDAEGNRVPVPVQEIANTGFYNHIEAFVRTYQFWYQSLKDELGEDPNLISQALQPRVTAGNVQASQVQAEYATDQYYRAWADLMKQTSRKISCLVKDSVVYGGKAYRQLAKKEDFDNRVFSTEIRFLPTDQEIQQFDFDLQQSMNTTPELSLFINPMQLRRVAKEDVKLAEALFRQGQKKMILWQQANQQQNQQATFQAQLQSGVAAEQERRKTVNEEVKTKSITELLKSKENQKEALINGFMGALGKGVSIPQEWKQVETELIQNIAIPLFKENIESVTDMVNQAIAENEQMEQQQNEQQQQASQQQMVA